MFVSENTGKWSSIDADFALVMRMLSALAFVPVSDVVAAFDSPYETGVFPDEVQLASRFCRIAVL